MTETPAPVELLQAMLESGRKIQDLVLDIQGHEITVKYRPLTWLEKSDVLSEALEYRVQNTGGEMELVVKIHHDVFRRAALKKMIVECPLPLTSDKVLDSLPVEIGEQLEKIIPSPFSSEQASALKKESESSSEEPEE